MKTPKDDNTAGKQYECPVCGPQEKPCSEMAAELNEALYPTLSGFADWYALHGIPLGIGRGNACVIYDAAVKDFAERSDRWFRAIQQELETVKAAFNEVEGQRNSLVTEVGNLRIKLHSEREASEAAITERKMAVIDTTIAHNDILERIELTFSMLYDKWLSAGHRRDMNEAMELMARELGSPLCPDCKCELVKPGNTCSMCDRPPEHSEFPFRCIHCNLPLHRHAPDLHSNGKRSCPDAYGWHQHNVFAWSPGA